MENTVILIGPRQWGEDHIRFVQKNGSSALQYSARVSNKVITRLRNIVCKRSYAYIYVPKRYKCGDRNLSIKGSGKLEFCCEIIDVKISTDRISPPWPTINGPMYYDKYQDFRYEFWFRVKHLSPCNLDISSAKIVLSDGTVKTYQIESFARSWRGTIAFAIKP